MKWRILIAPLSWTAMVGASVYLGHFLSRHFNIIPSFLLHIPEYDVSIHDVAVICKTYMAMQFIVMLLSAIISGPDFFSDSKHRRRNLQFLCHISSKTEIFM